MTAIFLVGSYSFTLGYMEYLKIPETPEYLEASNFFIRAVFRSEILTFIAVLLFAVAIFDIIPCLCEKLPLKSCLKLKYFPSVVLITAFGFGMYLLGEASPEGKKGIYPRAVLFIDNDEIPKEKRIVWFGKKVTYYLDCEPFQPEIRGVNDERKVVFSRRIDNDLDSSVCGK